MDVHPPKSNGFYRCKILFAKWGTNLKSSGSSSFSNLMIIIFSSKSPFWSIPVLAQHIDAEVRSFVLRRLQGVRGLLWFHALQPLIASLSREESCENRLFTSCRSTKYVLDICSCLSLVYVVVFVCFC